MRSHAVVGVLLFTTIFFTLPGGQVSAAQEATPLAGAVGLPVTPGPEDCTVEPVTGEALFARANEPVPVGTPGAPSGVSVQEGPTPVTPRLVEGLPPGQAIGEPATTGAMVETVRTWIACGNRGDERRFFAVMTPELVFEWLEIEPATGAGDRGGNRRE